MQELEKNAAVGVPAYAMVKKLIVDSNLRPGELISESDLAERLDIGEPLIRAAVERLVEDGLVNHVDAKFLQVAALDRKYIDDVYQVSKALEIQVAVQSIDHIPADAVEEFAMVLENIRPNVEAGNPYPVREAYEHLQRMFLTYCENDLICLILGRLQDHLTRVRLASRATDDRQWLHIEYWVMKNELDALRARDVNRLTTTLSAHMDMFRRWILQSWISPDQAEKG
ncbi:GntR family transcriptional regulator [Mesorhizobium sp. M4A.F.Ca.ET.050.02.1.1]|uniref:GntR family transcriptional regulator n=1 Tax=Mesorhizobium sp. M4A.F.Ca.ET.050.02.1.1 TaxID=2496754 RepID=UPI000FCACE57|nr:GntR family transcriptional regulator [Mesorhizobium sp. M4A.F.Ca.ET.050.02.1.1]RUX50537.1 GntR family transcriptional regulator [Mesorhizobium sp. M4A.F.Ca.ET.050.02.1.1]